MNRDLSMSFLFSFCLHFLLLISLTFIVTQIPSKETFFTEITVIGISPYGNGLGKKGAVIPSEPIAAVAQKPIPSIFEKKDIKQTDDGTILPKVDPRTDEYIKKLRETIPIGVALSSVSPTSAVNENNFGFGEDSKEPGVPWGSPNAIGPLAQRGVKTRIIPDYPEWAREKNIEGKVTLGIIVTPCGNVKEDIKIIQKSGFKELDDLAIKSMKKWVFEQLPNYIKQEDQYGTISFKFDLK